MTYGGAEDGNLSKNERREAARKKAKALRDQHRKKDRRNRYLLQGGLIVGALAIVVLVLVLVNTVRPPSPGPLNMLSDGIKIGQGLKAVPTPALRADQEPVPNVIDATSDVIDIQIYVDYFCPFCKLFEQTNSEQIESWLDLDAASVEIHPIAILNPNSQGTQYSTRSANAAACVANYSPDSYWSVNTALFANQPKERTQGLTDDQLVDIVTDAGVSSSSVIEECIRDQDFKQWVQAATLRALEGPIPNAKNDLVADNKVGGTPTVLVNGVKYKGGVDDADAFAAFVVQAAGASFTEESATSTPTPTPTAVPSVTPTKTPTPTKTSTTP